MLGLMWLLTLRLTLTNRLMLGRRALTNRLMLLRLALLNRLMLRLLMIWIRLVVRLMLRLLALRLMAYGVRTFVVGDVPEDRLGAQFVCAAALVVPPPGPQGPQDPPDGPAQDRAAREWVVTGRVEGRLIRVPRGTGGFGYDPIFLPDGFDLTTAEMTAEAKDAISHRGRAFRALTPFITPIITGAPNGA